MARSVLNEIGCPVATAIQRQGGDTMPAHLAEDAPGGVARAGVDEHVPHQVDVDRVRREAVEPIQAVGQALHDPIRNPSGLSLVVAGRNCHCPRRDRSSTSPILDSAPVLDMRGTDEPRLVEKARPGKLVACRDLRPSPDGNQFAEPGSRVRRTPPRPVCFRRQGSRAAARNPRRPDTSSP